MPKKVAQAPAAVEPAAVARIRRSGRVFSALEQEAFNAEGDRLAAALGFEGPDHFVLNDVRVADAKAFCRKVMHETHQAALTPEKDEPEAAAVCAHLGFDGDAEALGLVEAAIAACLERETAANYSDVRATEAARVELVAADLTGSAGAMLGKLAEGEAKAGGKAQG